MESATTKLRPRKICNDAYKRIAGPHYQQSLFENFGEEDGLSPSSIEKYYESFSDAYISHDWGRELGIDNHSRVNVAHEELCSKHGLKLHFDLFGTRSDVDVYKLMECTSCGVVFVTRRYVRRISEGQHLAWEYKQLLKCLGPQRLIFVLMETRMYNRNRWMETLGVKEDEASHVLEMGMEGSFDGLLVNIEKLYTEILKVIQVPLKTLSVKLYEESYEVLFDAVRENAVNDIQEFVESVREDGVISAFERRLLDFQDNQGATLIYYAASKGYTNMIRILDTAKADLNLSDNQGCTPLFVAAQNGYVDAVKVLAEAGSKIDQFNENGWTPLYVAAKEGHAAVVAALIQSKADVNVADRTGLTPLDIASDLEVIGMLTNITDVHKKLMELAVVGDAAGFHSLREACPQMHVDFENEDGRTALYFAASGGFTEMVLALLEAGASVAVRDNWEESVLTVTCLMGEARVPAIVQALLDAGADVNHRNTWGNSAMFNLLVWGSSRSIAEPSPEVTLANISILLMLIRAGADVNMPGQRHHKIRSPLRVAVDTEQFIAIKLLLEAGASLDAETAALMLRNYPTYFHDNGRNRRDSRVESQDIFESINESQSITPTTMAAVAATTTISIDGSQCLTMAALKASNYGVWFTLLQLETNVPEELEALMNFCLSAVKQNPLLANAKDEHGRIAVDVATKSNKEAINSFFLWYGRYRIIDQHPDHVSATCYVYRAYDEGIIDESGYAKKVALKLMRYKSHFLREINTRRHQFDPQYVVDIVSTYRCNDVRLPMDASFRDFDTVQEDCFAGIDESGLTMEEAAAISMFQNGKIVPHLTKSEAEKMFCLVMPLADRNMYVCLKQERLVSTNDIDNLDEVTFILKQLVYSVQHVHSKGIVHADIKPLNIVRTSLQWKLIDLDASCRIGVDTVGFKSSSAWIPPEAVYADSDLGIAVVKSEETRELIRATCQRDFELLIAQPSFDVWSLGCILYQMCTTDVRPLFRGGQDDNLIDSLDDDGNNLFTLAEWSDDVKGRRLHRVRNTLARNLLSQMLHKDPVKRPSLERVLTHPFITKRRVTRMIGEKADFDVFLSYRVASDALHAEELYRRLTSQGIRVWWDKKCLLPGVNWEKGFCAGLVSSRYLICILSRGAINHPTKNWQNFSHLTTESNCDNVLLEQRLGLELRNLGLIEKIFPVLVGDNVDDQQQLLPSASIDEIVGVEPVAAEQDAEEGDDDATATAAAALRIAQTQYSNFFSSGCLPTDLPDVAVASVEEAVKRHMDEQGLGSPLEPDKTVASVLTEIMKCNGALIEGAGDASFDKAVEYLLSDHRRQEEERAEKVKQLKVRERSIISRGSIDLGLQRVSTRMLDLGEEVGGVVSTPHTPAPASESVLATVAATAGGGGGGGGGVPVLTPTAGDTSPAAPPLSSSTLPVPVRTHSDDSKVLHLRKVVQQSSKSQEDWLETQLELTSHGDPASLSSLDTLKEHKELLEQELHRIQLLYGRINAKMKRIEESSSI